MACLSVEFEEVTMQPSSPWKLSNPFLPLPHPAELSFHTNTLWNADDLVPMTNVIKNSGYQPSAKTVTKATEHFCFAYSTNQPEEQYTLVLNPSEELVQADLSINNDKADQGTLCSEENKRTPTDFNLIEMPVQQKLVGNCSNSLYSTSERLFLKRSSSRETTRFLQTWLQEHRMNPYPTKAEKVILAVATQMNFTQISTWFANARRRLKKNNRISWKPRHRLQQSNEESFDALKTESLRKQWNSFGVHENAVALVKRSEFPVHHANLSSRSDDLAKNLRNAPYFIVKNLSVFKDYLHEKLVKNHTTEMKLNSRNSCKLEPNCLVKNSGRKSRTAVKKQIFHRN